MSIILKITFFILTIICGGEEENKRNLGFLNAKFGNNINTNIANVYSSLCDIIRKKDFEFLEKKDLINSEKKFIINAFKIIENLLLDENAETSSLILMIVNFPSLTNSIIDKKNAEIIFTVVFIQLILFLEDIKDFISKFPAAKDGLFKESEDSEDTIDKKAMVLLNSRVDLFFSSSNEMLKKSNGSEYWKVSEVLDFTVNLSDEEKDEQPGSSEKIFLTDNLNDLFISNNFLRVKNKTTNFAFSEDELKKTKNVISFVSISSFCIPKVFRFLKTKENISYDETNAIFELGNLLERRIPDEGTIIVPFKEKKLLMDFIIRLFYCIRSYTPESVCLNVSSLENDLKVSFSIQQNSWNFISKSNSEKIRYLCLLNQILDRKHREYHINKTSIENLIIYGDEIYNEVIMQSENMLRNENTRTTGSLRRNGNYNRSGFIRQTGSLERNSSVRKRLSLLFKNSADRQKIFSSETFNEYEPIQDLDKEKLIEALKRFHDLINHEEIDWFLHYNASMNNFDLTTATNIKKFPEFFKIINYFVDYGTSGFSIDLQSDSIYILKKTEIEREMRSLKVEYDLESIKSYFSVDILNEENEKKIFGSLLLSMASYFNVKHSQCVYDCLILLRRYIEGNLTNKENLDRKEVVNVILRSIEINRKRRRYFGRLIHNKLSEMMKE